MVIRREETIRQLEEGLIMHFLLLLCTCTLQFCSFGSWRLTLKYAINETHRLTESPLLHLRCNNLN